MVCNRSQGGYAREASKGLEERPGRICKGGSGVAGWKEGIQCNIPGTFR